MSSDANTLLLAQIWDKVKNLDAMERKIDDLSTRLDSISTTVTSLQSTVDTHTSDIAQLRSEIKTLKTSQQVREQRLRASTIRLFNYPYFAGESLDNFKALTAKVYDRVIRPTLVAAKSAGDVGSVQQQQNVVESCFRVYPRGHSGAAGDAANDGATGPSTPSGPIIIRLSNTAIKSTIMKHRKSIPPPSDGERRDGVRRFVLVEDLTPEAYGLLKALQQDTRTEKVWSSHGQLFYTVPGVPGYKRVRNIFDSIDTILA